MQGVAGDVTQQQTDTKPSCKPKESKISTSLQFFKILCCSCLPKNHFFRLVWWLKTQKISEHTLENRDNYLLRKSWAACLLCKHDTALVRALRNQMVQSKSWRVVTRRPFVQAGARAETQWEFLSFQTEGQEDWCFLKSSRQRGYPAEAVAAEHSYHTLLVSGRKQSLTLSFFSPIFPFPLSTFHGQNQVEATAKEVPPCNLQCPISQGIETMQNGPRA